MRAPLSWLRDFAPFPADVDEVAARLSGIGLVVESVVPVAALDGVVVARVEATRAHPDADRVQLVDVTVDGRSLQIVCGAFNFGPGDLVALAEVGTVLPGGMKIARRKVRGQSSEGMLCSASELGLGEDHRGILVLAGAAEVGQPVTQALGLAGDVVFDLDVTPNRPDALCILGVARDLAAAFRLPLQVGDPRAEPSIPDVADLAVDSPDLCPRFTATVLKGASGSATPAWMAARLTLAGMRPISPLVDISNYVMLELGQPNHPYDRGRLGGGGISIRRARPGEEIVTLDGVVRSLTEKDCLICDAQGTAVGIGGIMGGAPAEIGPDTSEVLLEVAAFDPMAIAWTSRRLGLRTEASVRFERGVDPAGIDRAVARFCELATEMTSAEVGPVVDRAEASPAPVTVTLRPERVNRLLGTDLEADEMASLLAPIGFISAPVDGGMAVRIPTWRPDSTREIDVVEEIARHHGYNRIARTTPAVRGRGHLTARQRERRELRQVLVGAGASEAWSSSLVAIDDLIRARVSTDAVELSNPLARDESALRTSLRPGLLRAGATNRAHRNPQVDLFELGRVFLPPEADGSLPREPEHLAVVGTGRDAAWSKVVLDGLARALQMSPSLEVPGPDGYHPGRSARIATRGVVIGAVGELDPDVVESWDLEGPVAFLEMDLDALASVERTPTAYRPVSRFPSADFDLAFVVDEALPAADLQAALAAAAGEQLEEIALFDVFRGGGLAGGHRSLAYRLRLVADDHTLSEDELAAIRQRCISAGSRLGAELRG